MSYEAKQLIERVTDGERPETVVNELFTVLNKMDMDSGNSPAGKIIQALKAEGFELYNAGDPTMWQKGELMVNVYDDGRWEVMGGSQEQSGRGYEEFMRSFSTGM